MPFEAKLTGEAASLARAHDEMLRRLPVTVHAFVLVDLQRWDALFPAEQRYQRTLLEHLSEQKPGALAGLSSGIARVEADAALTRISERDPARFQDAAQASLRKQNLVAAWRREVDQFFQRIDPAVEARLFPPDAPRRVVLQVYGDAIAVQPEKPWGRFKAAGMRIPLRLEGVRNSGDYLRTLFGLGSGATGNSGASLFGALGSDPAFAPADAWNIESHRGLHDLVQKDPADARLPTGLSYERL